MRRLIYVMIVLAAAGALYYSSRPKESVRPDPPYMERVEFALDSAVVQVPEHNVRVKLADGRAEFESGPVRGTVEVEEISADMRTGTGYDLLGVIRVNSGGSGTFSYLALFHLPAPDSLEHRDSILLGDRVQIVDLRTEGEPGPDGYGVTVTTLGRREGEPMTAPPTIQELRAFTVKDHRFVR